MSLHLVQGIQAECARLSRVEMKSKGYMQQLHPGQDAPRSRSNNISLSQWPFLLLFKEDAVWQLSTANPSSDSLQGTKDGGREGYGGTQTPPQSLQCPLCSRKLHAVATPPHMEHTVHQHSCTCYLQFSPSDIPFPSHESTATKLHNPKTSVMSACLGPLRVHTHDTHHVDELRLI
eukprot:1152316-Pelagomonas_calceolata.AAC.5